MLPTCFPSTPHPHVPTVAWAAETVTMIGLLYILHQLQKQCCMSLYLLHELQKQWPTICCMSCRNNDLLFVAWASETVTYYLLHELQKQWPTICCMSCRNNDLLFVAWAAETIHPFPCRGFDWFNNRRRFSWLASDFRFAPDAHALFSWR